jgi:DNA (cytosine-5)-methyltransferase 1
MTNHPNRSRRKDAPGRNPAPDEIRQAREAAGLSQKDAAWLVHSSPRSWEKWEQGERRMHAAFWELFTRKIHGRVSRRDPSE